MNIEVEESDVSTTKEAIRTLEGKLGYTFPPPYREFLLSTNGGRPKAPIFPIANMPLNPTGGVNFFLGIKPQWNTYDIEENHEFHKGRIPAKILLIADNGGGDYVCIDLRDGKERVMFWDHRPFWNTGEWSERDLYFVADTFEAFVNGLRSDPS